MNTALWIAQIALATLFAMAGFTKSTQPIDKLALKMPWVKDFPVWLVRFIGITQLLAAFGLVLPMVTGIAPVLTLFAALGLALTMALAALHHLRRSEYSAIVINLVLLTPMLFVVYGRGFYAPSCGS
jgi:putative oxidoreductase